MNIFTTSPCPKESAIALDDKRLIKMILESAQMLCTALYSVGFKEIPYKPTHANHPCTIWARESYSNYCWLYNHMIHLNNEYERRFNNGTHKSIKTLEEFRILENACGSYAPIKKEPIKNEKLTPFVNCTKNHKHIEDTHEAYKQCLIDKWNSSIPKWTNATMPVWYKEKVKTAY